MAEQLPMIFAERPLARRRDPLSSHEAADRLQGSGRLGQQRMQCLALVERYPGRTSRELAETDSARALELDRYVLARRLPELHDANRIDATGRGEGEEGPILWWPKEIA